MASPLNGRYYSFAPSMAQTWRAGNYSSKRYALCGEDMLKADMPKEKEGLNVGGDMPLSGKCPASFHQRGG